MASGVYSRCVHASGLPRAWTRCRWTRRTRTCPRPARPETRAQCLRRPRAPPSSRALARSRMLRQSSVFVLSAPTRSAWPGRGVTSRTRSSGASPNGAMRSVQFSQSRFFTIMRNGTAHGTAEADAGDNLHRVTLDLLATAATIARLAARKVDVDLLFGHLQARGNAFDDGNKPLSMAFACSVVTHVYSFVHRARRVHAVAPSELFVLRAEAVETRRIRHGVEHVSIAHSQVDALRFGNDARRCHSLGNQHAAAVARLASNRPKRPRPASCGLQRKQRP